MVGIDDVLGWYIAQTQGRIIIAVNDMGKKSDKVAFFSDLS